jgi:hypothetical protein
MLDRIKSYLDELDDSTLLNMWNEYCHEGNCDDVIYDIEEFDEIFQDTEPHNLACRVYYGEFCPQCEYFTFNAYGNLESIDYYELKNYIYIDDLANYIIDNDYDFRDNDIREILDEKFEFDDDLAHDLIFENIDHLREMGHKIKEPRDEELENIWCDINDNEYINEEDLNTFIVDLVFKYLGEENDE